MRRLDLGEGFAHDGGGGGAGAVEVEGDGEEKAALKEEQLEQSASWTPEAEAHFGLVGPGYQGLKPLRQDYLGLQAMRQSRNLYRGKAASFYLPRVSSAVLLCGFGGAKAHQQDSPFKAC